MWRAALAVLCLGCAVPAPSTDAPLADAPLADAPLADAADAGPDASTTGWRFEAIDGHCANGSPFAIATSDGDDELVLVLEGGGACWSDATCNTAPAAIRLHESLAEDEILALVHAREDLLFSRDPAVGPFASASFVWVPYCTGDFHVGRVVRDYAGGTIEHVGGANLDAVLARLSSRPFRRVVVVGLSAGGYAALVSWDRVATALATARIDVLLDSSPAFAVPDARWATLRDAWEPILPACAGCAASLGALVDARFDDPSGARFGFLGHQDDALASAFFGLGAGELATAYRDATLRFEGTRSHRTFVATGTEHLTLRTPTLSAGGVTVAEWVRAFADGGAWESVGP